MNSFFKTVGLLFFFILSSSLYAKGSVVVDVSVPGMSFKAISKSVKGKAIKKGKGFIAKKITVSVNSLKTEMDLRDEHLHKKVAGESNKYPKVIISSGKASGGKGKAKIKIHGVKKTVSFKYKTKGKNFIATFDLSLKSFGITGISYMGLGVADKITVKATLPIK